jgi:hypothetical protein
VVNLVNAYDHEDDPQDLFSKLVQLINDSDAAISSAPSSTSSSSTTVGSATLPAPPRGTVATPTSSSAAHRAMWTPIQTGQFRRVYVYTFSVASASIIDHQAIN